MNTRAAVFTLYALIIAAAAAPGPSPIDANTASVIAANDSHACSSGSCNINPAVAETNVTNAAPVVYSSAASARQLEGTWQSFTFLAVGGLALSTGML